uniref:GNAT family N-acetyltransferase n=1 Tax=Oscillatoria sp. FACHB-1407 TaxID=2692847 RepID=UPI0018EFCFEE|nr:GNAT family N-acetyltransferase [Oscillatoria sp. FACHB-1407]
MTSTLTIRPATSADAEVLFHLIQALAEYEKLSHAVTGNAALLATDLSGDRPACEAILAEHEGNPIGFALFFSNYSTFLTKPGIYLEDLFVLPEYRGQGVGKALLAHLAKLAQARDCGRLEWSVLDWNEPAIAFYRRIGATLMEEWRICRVTGEAIAVLASQSET